MKAHSLFTLVLFSSLLVGCGSNSENKKENVPPSIDTVSYSVSYNLQEDKSLLLAVEGTVFSSDEDGIIESYEWKLLTSQAITLDGYDTDTVNFEKKLINSEEVDEVILEVSVMDNDGAQTTLNTFEVDINDYLAVYLWDTEAKAGETIELKAGIYGRESNLASLTWSVKSEHNIQLLDANTGSVSFVAPNHTENNVVTLELKYEYLDGQTQTAEAHVTIVP